MNDLLLSVLFLMCNDDFCFCSDDNADLYNETLDFGINNNYDNLETVIKEKPSECQLKKE